MEVKAQEHLENTYEIVGVLSKNELKKMNSFKDEGIEFKEKISKENNKEEFYCLKNIAFVGGDYRNIKLLTNIKKRWL